MKDFNYNKICDVVKLTEELKAAAFNVIGVTFTGSATIVYLADTETKDPKTIVEAHVLPDPVMPPPPESQEDQINDLGAQLFDVQTQLLQAQQDNANMGSQLFDLQTQLLTKGVL